MENADDVKYGGMGLSGGDIKGVSTENEKCTDTKI